MGRLILTVKYKVDETTGKDDDAAKQEHLRVTDACCQA